MHTLHRPGPGVRGIGKGWGQQAPGTAVWAVGLLLEAISKRRKNKHTMFNKPLGMSSRKAEPPGEPATTPQQPQASGSVAGASWGGGRGGGRCHTLLGQPHPGPMLATPGSPTASEPEIFHGCLGDEPMPKEASPWKPPPAVCPPVCATQSAGRRNAGGGGHSYLQMVTISGGGRLHPTTSITQAIMGGFLPGMLKRLYMFLQTEPLKDQTREETVWGTLLLFFPLLGVLLLLTLTPTI